MARDAMIAAKVTRREKQFVRAAAAELGESESELLRRLALEHAAQVLRDCAARYPEPAAR